MTTLVIYRQHACAVAALLVSAIGGCAAERADAEASRRAEVSSARPSETEYRRVRPAPIELACGAVATASGNQLTLEVGESAHRLSTALAEGPVAAPDGTRLVWTEAARTPGATMLRTAACADGLWSRPVALVDDRGCPDRIVFSPDGLLIAYVSSSHGVAAIFAVDADGGSEPVQVTSRGVSRADARPGRPPAGFVAVPHDSPIHFDGRTLRWQAADGPHQAVLP